MKEVIFFVGFYALSFAPAFAEQPKEFSIKLTEQELVKIGDALMKEPYREVAPLVAKISQQYQQANKPATEELPNSAVAPAKE